jgi:hypothetical protein
MTSKDDINVDDAEFEDFLQGRGGLAQNLRDLPQPEPSAELDAAILAAAKAELENHPVATVAANDDTLHASNPPPRSFLRRWRVPLGVAASLLVTVQLVRMQSADESFTANTPPAPASMPAAAPAPEPAAAPSAAAQAEKRKPDMRAHEPPSEIAVDRQRMQSAPSLEPEYKRRARDTDRAEAANPSTGASEAPSQKFLRREENPEPKAQAAAPNEQAVPAQRFADTPPAPDAMPAPAARAMAPAAAPPPNPIAAPAPARAYANRAQVNADAAAKPTVSPAEAWLTKIDRLLQAGSQKDALDEWAQFRKAYPEYPVPDKLKEQIKVLQSAKP